MIDELALLLVHQGIGIEDAVALLKGAYIDVVRAEHPKKTVAELCSSQGDEPAILPMSRNTAFAQTAKARSLRRASLARRIEKHIRHHLCASDSSPKTRKDVYRHLLNQSTFSSQKRAWFSEAFEEVFDGMSESGLLVQADNSSTHWVYARQHRDHTTEDTIVPSEANESEGASRDAVYGAEIARHVFMQMRSVLEGRLFDPHQTQTTRLPNSGVQTLSLTICRKDIDKIDQFFARTIYPFLALITEQADTIKVHNPTTDPTDPNFVSLYHVTWMWGPEFP